MSVPHDALKRALLQAGKADAPPAFAKRQLLDALGLGEDDVVSAADARTSGVRRARASAFRERPPLFAAVLDRGGLFYRRLGVPAALAIAAHAAVVALALYGSTRAPTSNGKEPELTVRLSAPALVAQKAPPGGAPTLPVELPKEPSPGEKPGALVAVRAEEATAEVSDVVAGQPTAAPPEGAPSRVAPGAPATMATENIVAGEVAAATPSPPDPFEKVLPFGEGMNRPHRLFGPEPLVPREAREARVKGTMLVKCVITTTGSLRGCHVLKSLPFMDQPVLAALARQRYTPVTFQGRPINVEYLIPLKIELP